MSDFCHDKIIPHHLLDNLREEALLHFCYFNYLLFLQYTVLYYDCPLVCALINL